MKDSPNPSSWGLGSTGKVFSKIYNVFYCSKKTEPSKAENDGNELQTVSNGWFEAIKSQDETRVLQLLKQGVDINAKDENGWSALHMCAWNGYSEICQTLVGETKCVTDTTGPTGSTPVSLASQQGHVAIVKMLIGAKCDLNKTASLGDNTGVSPLHIASQNGHKEIVHLLLKGGAVVNAPMTAKGIGGVTPLHLAVEADHMEVMDLLISAGCDIQSTTEAPPRGKGETNC